MSCSKRACSKASATLRRFLPSSQTEGISLRRNAPGSGSAPFHFLIENYQGQARTRGIARLKAASCGEAEPSPHIRRQSRRENFLRKTDLKSFKFEQMRGAHHPPT